MKSPGIISMHPNGNANVRAAMTGFARAGMLREFHTAIACFKGSLLHSISKGPLSEFRRREFDRLLKPYTHTHAFRELGRVVSMKAGWKNFYKHEVGPFSVDAVYRQMDQRLAKRILSGKLADAVYLFEDGAELTFSAARSKGIKCYYDLPIGYWRMARQLLEQERELRPDWAMTITGFNDSNAKLERKDRELELADEVFVASSFTAKTLKAFPGDFKPVHVIPYGFPNPDSKMAYSTDRDKPLKVLFVGGLSQRKGLANLFEAAAILGKSIQLTVVGGKGNVECAVLDKALQTCKWIPSLPHAGILKLMKEHDVLAFPSLFEGFGLVITEAMSQGTPVITTDRTAGPDIITPGKDGWIIEAGSTDALTEILEKLQANRDLVAEVGMNAFQTALKRSWNDYGNDLALSIQQAFNPQTIELNHGN